MLTDLRLYQLVSPSLPVGAFTYSQGLERAVEKGWVTDIESLSQWLITQMDLSLATLDLPLLRRIQQAIKQGDVAQAASWCELLLASRETKELRQEERQRGIAFARLLPKLGIELDEITLSLVKTAHLAAFALAAVHWAIDGDRLCAAYAWGWLENTVMTGVKLIPLGQSAGQQLLVSLAEKIPVIVEHSAQCSSDEIGSFTPAQLIASCQHETQYTRLFRS